MFRLLTLGGLSLVDDGAPVTGAASQRSRLALLAVLATAGPAGVARDKLLACLWPESEDERARHALKQAVYALRRDLGSEHAIAGTATLNLDPTIVSSDIRDFDDAIARGDDAAAVAAYAGPFLDGVFVRASPEFDQWAANERARLERAYLDAIGRLARAADAAGDTIASVQWWRRAAAAEPLSGRVALSLMHALAASGDTSAAIQHARVHDAVVRGELDTPAEDAVISFADELRSGTWTPPVRTSPVRTTPPAIAVNGDAASAPPPLESMPTAPATAAVPVSSTPSRSRWRIPALVAAVVLLGLGLAAVLDAATRARMTSIFRAPAASALPRRVVVAAFTNKTRDHSLDPVGELAADWLVRRLLEAEFEVVDARNSSIFSFRTVRDTVPSSPRDLATLAERKGAATVITGSYYRQGDSLLFEAKIIDPVSGRQLHPIRPVGGSPPTASTLLGALAHRVTAAMAAATDSTAGARTAAVGEPPSVDAYEHASRGWELFFNRPWDTTAVFALLDRAASIDTTYYTPLLMHAYVLDVKERWPDLKEAVKRLQPKREHMVRVEREALALFESDLSGDLLGRLRASRALLSLSPGSIDMSLLVTVSASYLNRSAEAYDALNASSPDEGINAVSPMYMAWRAVAEHTMSRFDDELRSAHELAGRFPAQRYGALALARAYAAKGDTSAVKTLLAKSGMNAPAPTIEARATALEAARELRAHGRPKEAAAIFAAVAAIAPRANAPRDERAKYGYALYEVGDFARARAVFTALLASDPKDLDLIGRLGTIAARTGDSATVRQIDHRLAEWREPYAMGRHTYWRAHLAALSGRGMEAVALLHSAVSQGHRLMDLEIITLHEDPDFASLWSDPAFRELVLPQTGPPRIP